MDSTAYCIAYNVIYNRGRDAATKPKQISKIVVQETKL